MPSTRRIYIYCSANGQNLATGDTPDAAISGAHDYFAARIADHERGMRSDNALDQADLDGLLRQRAEDLRDGFVAELVVRGASDAALRRLLSSLGED